MVPPPPPPPTPTPLSQYYSYRGVIGRKQPGVRCVLFFSWKKYQSGGLKGQDAREFRGRFLLNSEVFRGFPCPGTKISQDQLSRREAPLARKLDAFGDPSLEST